MSTIRHHEDLVAWQLAAELKKRVLQIIARPSVARHFKFCDQIRDSCRSGPANLAEGFWRYRPRDNARFVRIALGSLGETVNHLHDAFTQKYIDETDYMDVRTLAQRALKAAIAWHNYLDNCPDKPPTDRRRPRKKASEKRSDEKPADDSEGEAPQTKSRTTNQEPRTKNQEPKTENQKPRTQNQKPKTDTYR
jgi:four helix bundle protein